VAILALAATRIMLLAHYVSDVVAGLALGVLLDKVVSRLFCRTPEHQLQPKGDDKKE
jgi:membrane-associated phospholipid phosphatase